jgi:hypothetical protein
MLTVNFHELLASHAVVLLRRIFLIVCIVACLGAGLGCLFGLDIFANEVTKSRFERLVTHD